MTHLFSLVVSGVGGVTAKGDMARFSSRGMSTWELPFGYGRFKPDLTALGSSVIGSKVKGKSGDGDEGCRALSGTSVASPVVAGAIALLLSDPSAAGVRATAGSGSALVGKGEAEAEAEAAARRRRRRPSMAAVKQVLVESAVRHPASNVFEQGSGNLNVTGAHALLRAYTPKATLLPASLDMAGDCPYLWPHCAQPLFYTGGPAIANLTLLNGLGVSGSITASSWIQAPLKAKKCAGSACYATPTPELLEVTAAVLASVPR